MANVYQPSVNVTDVEGGRTTARLTVNVSSTQTAQQVKVVHWNIHKGREECSNPKHYLCKNSLEAVTSYLSESGAHIVSLNEVRQNHSSYDYPAGTGAAENQPQRIEDMLEAKTNQCWERHFTDADGGSGGNLGNLLLWRSNEACGKAQAGFARQSTARHLLTAAPDGNRSVGAVTLLIGGRAVVWFTTHLCWPCTTSEREAQVTSLKNRVTIYPDPRIIAGDFNANPGDSEIDPGMTGNWYL